MDGPTALVLGCSSAAHHGRDQLRRLAAQAGKRGVRLVGADLAGSLGAVEPGLFDEVVAAPVHDAAGCREWARTERPAVDAVLTIREWCVEPAAAVAAELGLAGNDPAAARTIRRKDLAHEVLRDAGLRQPRTALISDAAAAHRFVASTDGPWIVKPPDGVGSAGVSYVDSAAALDGALARIDGPALLETFVRGREFSAEGVCLGGAPRVLSLTEKRRTDAFVSTSHRTPADLPADVAGAAARDVERALAALGITHGIVHVELWADEDGTVVVGELHARPGGDFIHAITEEARPGLELYGMLLDDLLGAAPGPAPERAAAAGVDYLLPPAGLVTAVDGWPEVLADPAVFAAHLDLAAGDRTGPVATWQDRRGLIAVTGPDRPAVDATLARLRETVRVTVHPDR